MVKILLKNLSKYFGGVKAVDKLNLEIKNGEFLSLLGPSGCGKTTTLRLIAGLEAPTMGEIYFDDEPVTELTPAERNVAMVFQSYALYPHMTVFENISFPLEVRKTPKVEINRRVKEASAFLKIEELLNRKPGQLSGGQRQRVALARSIVRNPSAYLMDEPLSNLDAQLRILMRAELKKLQEKLGVTTIYVTHDQIEAMSMSKRVAVMNEGVLQQIGTSHELYTRPDNTWVAGFIGSPPMNLVDCTLVRRDKKAFLDAGEFTISLGENLAELVARNASSSDLSLGVRPENFEVHKTEQPNSIKGKVHTLEPIGESVIVNVAVGAYLIKAKAAPSFTAETDESVYLSFDEKNVYIYDRRGKILT